MSLRNPLILPIAASCVFVFVFALSATQAAADNTTLRTAGKSRDVQFKALGQKTRRAASTWRRSGFTRRSARRVLVLLNTTRGEINLVSRRVGRETPSTAGGITYKRLFFKSMDSFRRGLRLQALGVRTRTAGKVRPANSYFDRGERAHELAATYERQAIRAIESAEGLPG